MPPAVPGLRAANIIPKRVLLKCPPSATPHSVAPSPPSHAPSPAPSANCQLPTANCQLFAIDSLEPRLQTDAPISPGINVMLFGSVLNSTSGEIQIPFAGDGVAQPKAADTSGYSTSANIAGTTYDTYRAHFEGEFDLASADADTYFFRLLHTDGAILKIDGQFVIYAPSWAGDATLNGSVNNYDIGKVVSSGFLNDGSNNHTWADGDFNGDGYVTSSDFSPMVAQGHYGTGDFVTAYTLDNTTATGPSPIGFNLSAGHHSFSLDEFTYKGNDSANASLDSTLLIAKSIAASSPAAPGPFSTFTPYVKPVVTGVPVAAITGASGEAVGSVAATFIPAGIQTAASDYTAAIQWSDGSAAENAEIYDSGDGTFSVWTNHTFDYSGAYTGSLVVTHTPSGLASDAVSIAATVTDPAPPPPEEPPITPTGLTASYIPPAGTTGPYNYPQIGLVWDHFDNVTEFYIDRTRSSGDGQNDHANYIISDASANSFVDKAVDGHSTYSYTIVAHNDAGASAASSPVNITTPNAPPEMLTDFGLAAAVVQGQGPVQFAALPLVGAAFDPDPNDPNDAGHRALVTSAFPLYTEHGGLVDYDPDANQLTYTPSDYIGTDSFTYKVTDGRNESLEGTAYILVNEDTTGLQAQDLVFVPTGGTVPIPLPDDGSVTSGPFHGEIDTDPTTGKPVYHETDPGYVGKDYINYTVHQPHHQIEITIGEAPIALTPWRTGLKTDHQVLDATQHADNPADYVILVNNNFDEAHDDGSTDLSDDQANTPLSGRPTDPDLARIDVNIGHDLLTYISDGTISLEVSDPSAVRLYKDNGSPLTLAEQTVDLAQKDGYLGLGGTVWVEGLTTDADEKISLVYRTQAGAEITRDDVHMNIVKWDFVRKDGEINAPIDLIGLGTLQDAINDQDSTADSLLGSQSYKSHFEGIESTDAVSLRTYDASNVADNYTDTVTDGDSDHSSLAYATGLEHEILSADERSSLLSELGLEAVDPPAAATQATINQDLLQRFITAGKLPIWSDIVPLNRNNITYEQAYRSSLQFNFGSNPTQVGAAGRSTLVKNINAQNEPFCSQVIQWPLLKFAADRTLPVSFSLGTEGKKSWSNFTIESDKAGHLTSIKSNFNATGGKLPDWQQLPKTIEGLGPMELLNYEIDYTVDPVKVTPLVPHNTFTGWIASADDVPPMTGPGSELFGHSGNVPSIQVGDIVSTVLLPNWPNFNRNNNQGHADVITDIRGLVNGKPALTSEVYLMFDGETNNRWIKIADLLSDRSKVGGRDVNKNQYYGHNHRFVVASLDFGQFNSLYSLTPS